MEEKYKKNNNIDFLINYASNIERFDDDIDLGVQDLRVQDLKELAYEIQGTLKEWEEYCSKDS